MSKPADRTAKRGIAVSSLTGRGSQSYSGNKVLTPTFVPKERPRSRERSRPTADR